MRSRADEGAPALLWGGACACACGVGGGISVVLQQLGRSRMDAGHDSEDDGIAEGVAL